VLVPALLALTVILAVAFALTQVERVSTVHSSIGSDIDEQDRGILFTADGAASTVLIPAKNGRDIAGQVVVTNRVGATGTCQVQSTDGLTNISAAVAGGSTDSVPINTLGSGTPTGYTTGEGIQVVGSDTSTSCIVTVYFDFNNG
jgi:hypothetical protein